MFVVDNSGRSGRAQTALAILSGQAPFKAIDLHNA
jgi:hypothetical protein